MLKHELMHFKQLDHLANFLRELAQSVFFFHPAAWWVGRKWEEATELACDRAIIASHDESHDYAEQLYQMLLVVRNRRQMRLSAGLFATRTQIGRRIAALLSAHISTPSRLSMAMAIAVLVALSILTLSVGVGFAERASEEQKEEKKDSTSTAAVDQPEDGVVVSGRARSRRRAAVRSQAAARVFPRHSARHAARSDIYHDQRRCRTFPV